MESEDDTVGVAGRVCPVHEVEFRNIHDSLDELKDRVRRLESTLARGVMLLVANLVGVVLMLVEQLAGR